MTSPSPFPVKDPAFELIEYIEARMRHTNIQPLWLGGEADSAGSVGRPGGYIGLLPVNRVKYDSSGSEYSSGGSTLLDNLAQDRFRLTEYMRQLSTYVDSGGSWCSTGGSTVAVGGYPSGGSGATTIGFNPGNPPDVTNVQDAIEKIYNEGTLGFMWHQFIFTVEGNVATSTGRLKMYAPGPLTIAEVAIAVDNAPAGQSIIVDINKNGTTIFTDQGKRPTIAIGETFATSGTPDVTTLAKNDYVTMDVDQAGTTTPGSNLVVHVRCKQYSQ